MEMMLLCMNLEQKKIIKCCVVPKIKSVGLFEDFLPQKASPFDQCAHL